MQPVIFQLKAFTLHTLWIFIAIAMVSSIYALIKISIKNNLKVQFLSENFWTFLLYFIVGARLSALIIYYQTYFHSFNLNTLFSIFYIWDMGLNFWGGLIAMIICLYNLCKKSDQNFWKWLEVIVPAIIVGLAITHIGAFFDGINYGKPSSLPWASNFSNYSIKYAVPIHPTQIYAALYSAAIVVGLLLLNQSERAKKIQPEGFLGLLGIFSYSLFRFLESFLRGDDIYMLGPIRIDSILTGILLISTGTFLFLRYNRPDLIRKFKFKK